MFDPVDPKQSLPDMENGILQYWREEDIFKRSLKQRSSSETFSFYDGPPFATGLPHYGHLLAGTIKDVIPRYQAMRGKFVQRRFGWDCHGLPIENLIEQENGIENKQEIEEKGVKWFNTLCRASVQRYTAEWRKTVERMGRWVDMDWDYRTMDPDYMESMWWAFKTLHDKKLIYEGFKAMHICTRCVTPLSNFEVTQGYRDRTDMSVIMTFPLTEDPNTVILAWTTTPWSLPGNFWLAVGPDIEYVRVQEKGDEKHYVVAKRLVEKLFANREYEIVGDVDPHSLVGKTYEPLFPYFEDRIDPATEEEGKPQTFSERVFKIVMYDDVEVSDEDGTGIVHITSCLGEDSYAVAKREGIGVAHHLGMDGVFYDFVTDFAGMNAKPEGEDPMATDKAIIQNLKDRGRHFSSYTYDHSYPHCWRCDYPLLNYATSSWFVAVEKLKENMLANKDKTSWVPTHLKEGRYGKWIEGARDWSISRNRYWGTPLPIWRSGDDIEVIGSRDELMAKHSVRFTKLTAVRHGESVGNTIPIYQGVPPGTDLTDAGRQQAAETGEFLKTQDVSIIYCSPLARTQQTAQAIADATGAEIIIDERLRETEFGEYEGKTIDFNDLSLVKAKRAHKLQEDSPETIYHFEGMETWEDTNARLTEFLEDILPKHRSEHVVVVTHGDPVNNIRNFFTDDDPIKISHQPYPEYAQPHTFYWDHTNGIQMDLHRDNVDDVVWSGALSKDDVELTVVRHGETASNASDKENGWSDEPLSDEGRAQVEKTAAELQGQEFDVIICSDLPRAKETAEIIASALGRAIDIEWEELRERNAGSWVGRNQSEILEEFPHTREGTVTTAFHYAHPEGGESFEEFLDRGRMVLARLRKEYAGRKVLLVTHGGMIRVLRCLEENLGYADAAYLYPQNAETYQLTLHPQFTRIPEVLDCWFESGSMPYSQAHFPFAKGSGDVPPGFPAEFIAEGVDQTRAWFYVLMVLSTALFDETPFKNVVVNGIVLAEDGKKMSKRLKNYPEPMEIVEKYGADAIRFTLMSSPAVRAEDLRISERLIEEKMRKVLLPIWNVYSFFVTYANAANFEPVDTRRASTNPLDVWIKAEVQDLVNRMTNQLDNYDLSATCNELDETIDALTNWYVRLSRRRFAGKAQQESAAEKAHINVTEEDQEDALHTLYDVLLTFSQLLAPFCPFISDAIYLNLVSQDHGSIHLTDWPESNSLDDKEQNAIAKNRLQRLVVSLGNSIRAEKKIKIRQPLASATIAVPPAYAQVDLSTDDLALLATELNVKSVDLTDDPGSLAQQYALVNARAVGPRLGKRVQEIIQAGKAGEYSVNDDGTIAILDETLQANEVDIVYRGAEGSDIAADKGVVVSLDTTVTESLQLEGQARDLIRTIQRLRKDAGLEFTDTVRLSVVGADDIIAAHRQLIEHENNATFGDTSASTETIELDGKSVTVSFEKL